MRTPNTICDVCGTEFYKRPKHKIESRTHCCSHSCQNILRKERMSGSGNHQFGLKGELNSSFKKDYRISSWGYLLIREASHPLRMHNDFVFAHRLLYENYLLDNDSGSEYLIEVDGRLVLDPAVVIHHLDGNKLNNSISNLGIMDLGDHSAMHNVNMERNADGTFKCIRGLVKEGKLERAFSHDAGQDVYSNESTLITARSSSIISTNLYIQVPEGFVGLLWSRSGLSFKHGIEVGAGCIDSGYTGEIKVKLFNHSDRDYQVNVGDKIAQLLTIPISLENYRKSDQLPDTTRGTLGFGSTGK